MQKFLRGRALPQGEDFPPAGAARGKGEEDWMEEMSN